MATHEEGPLAQLIDELRGLLEEERRALLRGSAEAISAVAQRKMVVADMIDRAAAAGAPPPRPDILAALARCNRENGVICAAMLGHLTAALDRLLQYDPHRSYNSDGSEGRRTARHALGAA